MRLTFSKSTLDTLSGIIQPDCSDHSILKIRGLAVFSIVDICGTFSIIKTSTPDNAIAQTCAFFRYGISPEEVNIAIEFAYFYRADVDRDRETHKLALTTEKQKETMKKQPKETMKKQPKEQPKEQTYDVVVILKHHMNHFPALYTLKDSKPVSITKPQLDKLNEFIAGKNQELYNARSLKRYTVYILEEDATDEIMQECFPETIKITVEISEHYNGETVVKSEYADFNNFICRMM